jgi:hypothetical protein
LRSIPATIPERAPLALRAVPAKVAERAEQRRFRHAAGPFVRFTHVDQHRRAGLDPLVGLGRADRRTGHDLLDHDEDNHQHEKEQQGFH